MLKEKQYYDFQLYSHLINEFKNKHHKFVKIGKEKPTKYENKIVGKVFDENLRAKQYTRLMPSGNSDDYNQMIRRRYLNELLGCALANGFDK